MLIPNKGNLFNQSGRNYLPDYKTINHFMSKKLRIFKTITMNVAVFALLTAITTTSAYAANDPTAEITSMVDRIVKVVTQIGSAVFILFIIKDAFNIITGSEMAQTKATLLRDLGGLIIGGIFLFKPELILDAIKFIANV